MGPGHGAAPEIRTGCDLVIEFPLIEGLEILRTLAAKNISPSKWFRFPVLCWNR
ncbi:MAG: hypothetical protein R2860_01450 [Desulfobacterales bacterium]